MQELNEEKGHKGIVGNKKKECKNRKKKKKNIAHHFVESITSPIAILKMIEKNCRKEIDRRIDFTIITINIQYSEKNDENHIKVRVCTHN